jgi:malonyl-CoA/methylmalonyl-CoA synthetase
MGVPTMYHRLLNQWEDFEEKPDVRSVRIFISGSAPLSENHFSWFENSIGRRILERYGMTETGMNTSNPYAESERKAGSVGYPLPGVEIRVVDLTGNDVQPGEVGEICIRGNNVFKGYWQNPEKTKESFVGSWFKSGDLGYQDQNDNMRLYIVGRFKEMIITGGYNVYPKEVENVVERYEGVSETAVFGVADEDLGERVIAVVVPVNSVRDLEETKIIDFCKKSLASYKCPKRVFFRRELPRTATGKLQKQVLKEIYSDLLKEI